MAAPPPANPNEPADWRRMRLWHIQPVRDVLVLAVIFGVFYLGYILSPITVPMLVALLLAYLFEPLVERITRGGHISRRGAAAIILAGFFLVVIVPLAIGVGVGVSQAVGLVENVARNTKGLITAVQRDDPAMRAAEVEKLPGAWHYLGKEFLGFRQYIIEEGRKPSGDQNGANPPPPADGAEAPGAPAPESAVPDSSTSEPPSAPKQKLYRDAYAAIQWVSANAEKLTKSLGEQLLATGQGALLTGLAILGSIAGIAFGGFLTAFFFFFFCTGWGQVLDFWKGLIPERKKGKAFDLLRKMDRVVAGFVRGRLTICAIMALVYTIAFWLIGVPMPLIVGPIAGLLYIVPFLHLLTIPIGILLLWLQPSPVPWQNAWWWIIFAPIGVDLCGQFIDDWILSPTIQGKTTNMDAPTILFASLAGGTLAGAYGLLVAIPVAACIKILIKELFWPRFRRWARGEERDFLPISTTDEHAAPAKSARTPK